MALFRTRFRLLVLAAAAATLLGGWAAAALGACGPFSDVAADAFCPFVLEIFYLGITTGTTATTYSPADNVTRLQMAAFLSRSVDGTLRRAGRRGLTIVRAANGAVLTTLTGNGLNGPRVAAFDGERVLVTNYLVSTVSLWNAADLSPLGSVSTGSNTLPFGAASDGANFWIVLAEKGQLARF